MQAISQEFSVVVNMMDSYLDAVSGILFKEHSSVGQIRLVENTETFVRKEFQVLTAHDRFKIVVSIEKDPCDGRAMCYYGMYTHTGQEWEVMEQHKQVLTAFSISSASPLYMDVTSFAKILLGQINLHKHHH